MIVNFMLAVILGVFIGGISGYLGSLMLTKRMSLIGGPLGHLTLPGISIALLYGFDVSLGALGFLIFGTILIWLLQQKTKLPFEAITATVFASSLSIAFLILTKVKSKKALIGDISQISPKVLLITAAAAVLIFVITRLIYSNMVLIGISRDLAKTNKINIKLHNFIYLACIAVVIALCVRIVGGLLTAAMVAIPACTSKNISINLKFYAYFSMIAGALACAGGILVSATTGMPPGPMIVIANTALFVASIFIKPYKIKQLLPK